MEGNAHAWLIHVTIDASINSFVLQALLTGMFLFKHQVVGFGCILTTRYRSLYDVVCNSNLYVSCAKLHHLANMFCTRF